MSLSTIVIGIGFVGLVLNTILHGNNWWLSTEAFWEAIFAWVVGIGLGVKIGKAYTLGMVVRHAKLAPREIDECVDRALRR